MYDIGDDPVITNVPEEAPLAHQRSAIHYWIPSLVAVHWHVVYSSNHFIIAYLSNYLIDYW